MILLDNDTKCLVQGITGKQGSFHTEQMLEYNTNILAGVTPGKGGQDFLGVPVFNSIEEAKEENVIDIEAKPEITFDDFEKLQFQVGKIISCEEVKKSKKLLCSQVQIGSQVRQIVSGIKAHYSAEEMVGKRVMVVTNLKPAKLAGILSEGMILCAEDADGNLSLMVPEKEMPAGAEIC